MQLGMVGLGRMGANLVRRASSQGHRFVVHDIDPAAVAQLVDEGATGADFPPRSRREAVRLHAPSG